MYALILDDNPADRVALARDLHRGGYATMAVTTLQQARQALIGQLFDLLILEVALPDGNGLQLCSEIREQLGDNMVIIFVSTYDTPVCRVVGIQLGADDFLGKPCDAEELLARIDARQRRRVIKHTCG